MIRSAFAKCTENGVDRFARFGQARMSTLTASSRSGRGVLGFGSPNASNDFHGAAKNNHSGGARVKIGYDDNASFSINRRWYTPVTKEDEEIEKARVSHLSPEAKEEELRKLNREIAKLETLRGINTGELYTWTGRYKALVKNYGLPLFVYYWSLWVTMGGIVYLGIDFGGLDAIALLERIDANTGWAVSDKVDPQLGKMGVALILNECLEPVRVPFVVVTLKPVMDIVSPPKY
mmetsp:Transcript_24063/g.66696  ORF Transcript_24063/g.66696 Transcript_24063/m.66696 type:complete len:234 (-) Transcript_24063:1239-1940(-)